MYTDDFKCSCGYDVQEKRSLDYGPEKWCIIADKYDRYTLSYRPHHITFLVCPECGLMYKVQ